LGKYSNYCYNELKYSAGSDHVFLRLEVDFLEVIVTLLDAGGHRINNKYNI